MSDTTTTPTPADVASKAPEPAQAPAAPEPTKPDAKSDDTDWKAEARKWEQRAKENKDAAAEAATLRAELDQIKQAQMSDLERAQAQAKEYEQAAAKAQAEALRWRIAAKHGISDEDAETFLTGADVASLTRQAERLASLATTAPTTPKPDRTQGGSGEPPALNSDALEDALRNAVGAR